MLPRFSASAGEAVHFPPALWKCEGPAQSRV